MILRSQYPMNTDSRKYAVITSKLLKDRLIEKSDVDLETAIYTNLETIKRLSGTLDIARRADQYLLVSIMNDFDLAQ